MQFNQNNDATQVKRAMDFTPTPNKRVNIMNTPQRLSGNDVNDRKTDFEKLSADFDGLLTNQVDLVRQNQPHLSDQAIMMAGMLGPMMKGMVQMMANLVVANRNDFVTHAEMTVNTNVNNIQLQGSLIEAFYDRDRIECRQRYANLRVSGFTATKDSVKDSLVDFADSFGVTMAHDDFSNTAEIKGYKGKGKAYVVSFATVYAREKFIDAKFNAIAEKNRLYMLLKDKPNDVELKRQYDVVAMLRIEEDLTVKRYKLLKVVREAQAVKKAYTRNAVVHAVFENRERGKVKLFSANDLHKIGLQRIPFDALDIPQRIADLYQAPDGAMME